MIFAKNKWVVNINRIIKIKKLLFLVVISAHLGPDLRNAKKSAAIWTCSDTLSKYHNFMLIIF